jgi:hypothetical protein
MLKWLKPLHVVENESESVSLFLLKRPAIAIPWKRKNTKERNHLSKVKQERQDKWGTPPHDCARLGLHRRESLEFFWMG